MSLRYLPEIHPLPSSKSQGPLSKSDNNKSRRGNRRTLKQTERDLQSPQSSGWVRLIEPLDPPPCTPPRSTSGGERTSERELHEIASATKNDDHSAQRKQRTTRDRQHKKRAALLRRHAASSSTPKNDSGMSGGESPTQPSPRLQRYNRSSPSTGLARQKSSGSAKEDRNGTMNSAPTSRSNLLTSNNTSHRKERPSRRKHQRAVPEVSARPASPEPTVDISIADSVESFKMDFRPVKDSNWKGFPGISENRSSGSSQGTETFSNISHGGAVMPAASSLTRMIGTESLKNNWNASSPKRELFSTSLTYSVSSESVDIQYDPLLTPSTNGTGVSQQPQGNSNNNNNINQYNSPKTPNGNWKHNFEPLLSTPASSSSFSSQPPPPFPSSQNLQQTNSPVSGTTHTYSNFSHYTKSPMVHHPPQIPQNQLLASPMNTNANTHPHHSLTSLPSLPDDDTTVYGANASIMTPTLSQINNNNHHYSPSYHSNYPHFSTSAPQPLPKFRSYLDQPSSQPILQRRGAVRQTNHLKINPSASHASENSNSSFMTFEDYDSESRSSWSRPSPQQPQPQPSNFSLRSSTRQQVQQAYPNRTVGETSYGGFYDRTGHVPGNPLSALKEPPRAATTEEPRDRFLKSKLNGTAAGIMGVAALGALALGPVVLLLGVATVGVSAGVSHISPEQRNKITEMCVENLRYCSGRVVFAAEMMERGCVTVCEEMKIDEKMEAHLGVNPGCLKKEEEMDVGSQHQEGQIFMFDGRGEGGLGSTAHYTGVSDLHAQVDRGKLNGCAPFNAVGDGQNMHTKYHNKPFGNQTDPSVQRGVSGNYNSSSTTGGSPFGNGRKVAFCRKSRIIPVFQIHSLDPSLQPKAWLDVMASGLTNTDHKNEAMEEILILVKAKTLAISYLEEGILDSLIHILSDFFKKHPELLTTPRPSDTHRTIAKPAFPPSSPLHSSSTDDEITHAKLAANCVVALGKAHCAVVHTEGDLLLMSSYNRGAVPVERQLAQMLYEVPYHTRVSSTAGNDRDDAEAGGDAADDMSMALENRERFYALTEMTMQQAEELAKSIKALVDGRMDDRVEFKRL